MNNHQDIIMIFIRATFPDIAYTEVYRGLYSGEKHEEKQFTVYNLHQWALL